jgi:murein DD-endopeptidase MepM/ murein hydrolase activator NlpD
MAEPSRNLREAGDSPIDAAMHARASSDCAFLITSTIVDKREPLLVHELDAGTIMRTDRAGRCSTAALSVLAALAAALVGCGGGNDDDAGPPLTDDRNPTPSASNTVVPLFYRPFPGVYPMLNYFDHDRPEGPGVASGGYQLTWRGEHAIPGVHNVGYDSHTGIDWIMPEGTPLLAMSDGLVIFAGETEPSYCVLEDNVSSTIAVAIRHPASNGETYTSHYVHMNRVDVAVGDSVTTGQQVGLSGATGCLGKGKIPHLHMNIFRLSNTNNGRATYIDPYGWQGAGVDPWSQHADGAASLWLWQPGEAPALIR